VTPDASGRRELLVAIVLCLVGSAFVLVAVSRAWVSYSAGTAPLPTRSFAVSGHRLVPGARALALVGLAGIAAIPATRRLARVAVGVVVSLAGLGIGAVVVRALADPDAAMRRAGPFTDFHVADGSDLGSWPYVALVGAVSLFAAGALVVVRGGAWASMAARYEAPSERRRTDGSLWEALDRGEDPTGEPLESGG
jgi:uncharacterized membrane protein (TIGR02234 family)